MKHVSAFINGTPFGASQMSDLRLLQVKREEAQAVNDTVALRALDDEIESALKGGAK